MADGKVTIELSVQDANAVAAWQRGRQGIGQMGEELKGVAGKARTVSTAGEDMAAKMVGGLAKMALGALSFQKALQFASREFQDMIARQERAAGFQVDVASAQREALRNLAFSEITPQELQGNLQTIAGETGAELRSLWQASSDVLSARGTLSEKEAVGQLGAVAKLDPSMIADDMKVVAGAALDMRKAFGGDAEQALGAILTSQQTARVTSTQAFARNAIPALFGLAKQGSSYREASALYSAITQESADVTGRRSGNAVIRFAEQLTKATASIDELKTASVHAKMEFLLSGDERGEPIRQKLLGNLRQEFEAASQLEDEAVDPEQKAQLHGEAKQFFALLQLLERGSPTRKAYESALAATPEYAQAGGRYQQNLEAQRQLGMQTTARLHEQARAATERAKSESPEAITGEVRKDAKEFLQQLGSFGVKSGVPASVATTAEMGLLFEAHVGSAGANPVTAVREVMEGRLRIAEESGQAELQENHEKTQALRGYIDALKGEEARTRDIFKPPDRAGKLMTGPRAAKAKAQFAAMREEDFDEEGNYLPDVKRAPAAGRKGASLDEFVASQRRMERGQTAEAAERKRTNDLLEKIVANTEQAAQPSRKVAQSPPQRPAPTIGGN